MSIFERTIQAIRETIGSEQFLNRHRTEETQFTRQRKLGFRRCAALILTKLSLSLQMELNRYFDRLNEEPVSQQAFSKARQHINPEAFRELYNLTVQTAFEPDVLRRYREYRLFAVDGTELALPISDVMREEYPNLGKEQLLRPRARASILCDLLDGYLLDVQIAARSEGERMLADKHFAAIEDYLTEKDIVMADRGYPSKALLLKLSQCKFRYVLRVSSSFHAAIDHRESDDAIIQMRKGRECFPVRVVAVKLSTGDIETLLTNLDPSEFETESFLDLYAMRWGVETVINRIKNRIQLEKFSGKTPVSVEQEFYAAAMLLNLATMLAAQAEQELAQKHAHKRLAYRYIPNYNLLVAGVKEALPDLLSDISDRKRNKLYRKLRRRALQRPSPVKPDRSFPRKDISRSCADAHLRHAF